VAEDGQLNKNKEFEYKQESNMFVKLFSVANSNITPYLNE